MNIDELDRLHAAATAGEWVDYCFADTVATTNGAVKVDLPGKQVHVCETRFGYDGDPDCRAIVALHNAWPAMSARLRAAEGILRELVSCDDAIAAGREPPTSRQDLAARARAALGEP